MKTKKMKMKTKTKKKKKKKEEESTTSAPPAAASKAAASPFAGAASKAAASPFAGISAVRDIMMWRVELENDGCANTLHILKVKKSKLGLFNDGDSYLVLDGRNVEADGGVRVILWIGPESELDERKGAASAAMQLEIDIRLGGAAVSFLSRVVGGGREGVAFRDMWRPGQYRVIAGGSETAYDPANSESWTPVLFHVKGTAKAMHMHKIPSIAAAMNHGDVFMLNAGKRVFTWIGCGASAFEMREGRRIGNELSKRQHASYVVIEDHAVTYVATEETAAFFALLEGDYEHIADDGADNDDEVEQSIARKLFSIYKLSDEQTGEVEVEALQRNVPLLDKMLLDTDDTFLIDLRSTVVVWIGKGATNQERLGVLAFTEEYLDSCEDDHLSMFTPVLKLEEGDAWPRVMRRAFNSKGNGGSPRGAPPSAVPRRAPPRHSHSDVLHEAEEAAAAVHTAALYEAEAVAADHAAEMEAMMARHAVAMATHGGPGAPPSRSAAPPSAGPQEAPPPRGAPPIRGRHQHGPDAPRVLELHGHAGWLEDAMGLYEINEEQSVHWDLVYSYTMASGDDHHMHLFRSKSGQWHLSDEEDMLERKDCGVAKSTSTTSASPLNLTWMTQDGVDPEFRVIRFIPDWRHVILTMKGDERKMTKGGSGNSSFHAPVDRSVLTSTHSASIGEKKKERRRDSV